MKNSKETRVIHAITEEDVEAMEQFSFYIFLRINAIHDADDRSFFEKLRGVEKPKRTTDTSDCVIVGETENDARSSGNLDSSWMCVGRLNVGTLIEQFITNFSARKVAQRALDMQVEAEQKAKQMSTKSFIEGLYLASDRLVKDPQTKEQLQTALDALESEQESS